MTSIPATIELTEAQRQHLTLLVEKTGKPWQHVLDDALAAIPLGGTESAAGHETLGDRMRRLGLLGCITSAPADLSTNPKYMEGFGVSGK
jgi:hypothetical protein